MKQFMHIEHIRETGNVNTGGFRVGDIINISEKLDGSQSSIRYNPETDTIDAFSSDNLLAFNKTLRGFWNYAQTLDISIVKDNPNYVIFGEWLMKNNIMYNSDAWGKWYVFDIFDIESCNYLPQAEVKRFTEKYGLLYVPVLYEGPFKSWEHCRSFCNSPSYGNEQEGVVVKNQTRLIDGTGTFSLKLVNTAFRETNRTRCPVKLQFELDAEQRSREVTEMIVTKRRVEKMIRKLQDNDKLPEVITKREMGKVSRILPTAIYEDCLREEKALVVEAGEPFARMCNAKTMQLAKQILLD